MGHCIQDCHLHFAWLNWAEAGQQRFLDIKLVRQLSGDKGLECSRVFSSCAICTWFQHELLPHNTYLAS